MANDNIQIEFDIDTRELTEALRDIKGYRERIAREVDRLVDLAALLLESEAKKHAPVDSGRLRASIFRRKEDLTAIVKANVVYADFVELGTRFMRAQPYLGPAYEIVRRQFTNEVKKLLRKPPKR